MPSLVDGAHATGTQQFDDLQLREVFRKRGNRGSLKGSRRFVLVAEQIFDHQSMARETLQILLLIGRVATTLSIVDVQGNQFRQQHFVFWFRQVNLQNRLNAGRLILLPIPFKIGT